MSKLQCLNLLQYTRRNAECDDFLVKTSLETISKFLDVEVYLYPVPVLLLASFDILW